MTFLEWLHDNYRIKKLDSSHEYKRIFLILYQRCVGHNLHGTGGSFGFPLITEFGAAMEQGAKDQEMSVIRRSLLQLEGFVGQVLRVEKS